MSHDQVYKSLLADNQAAVLSLLTSHIAVVKDAIEEMEQVHHFPPFFSWQILMSIDFILRGVSVASLLG